MAQANHFIIAKRYADALFSLSQEGKVENAVEKDMQVLAQAASEDRDFRRFLGSPLFSRAVKAKTMQAILAKGNAHALTHKFIMSLARNNRLGLLTDIAQSYFDMLAESRGEMPVSVTSAKKLQDAETKALASALTKLYGKKALIASQVDPSLIGGLIIRVGDMRIDYSVAGQLSRLNAQLKNTSLPAHA